MSLRSDPSTTNPQRNDDTTKNQAEWTRLTENNGQKGLQGDYDSTSSGGYGATPDETWSDRSQRGLNMPTSSEELHSNKFRGISSNDAGLIDQSADGTDLSTELQDAEQGRDKGLGQGSGGTAGEEDVWGVEKGAEKDF